MTTHEAPQVAESAGGGMSAADVRFRHISERLAAFRPDPSSGPTNRAVEDMKYLVATINDLRSRLGCVVEATYWDRPYDTRMNAIRGMCDLTTNGMTPTAEPAPTPAPVAGGEAS